VHDGADYDEILGTVSARVPRAGVGVDYFDPLFRSYPPCAICGARAWMVWSSLADRPRCERPACMYQRTVERAEQAAERVARV
jgi:hypothetical protein